MRSLVSLRATAPVIARSLVGFGLLAAFSYGCGVDNSGLGETSTKLQPAGGTGGAASSTGAGGETASGGVNGAGGALGSGGSIAVGGAPGTGGDGAGGTSSTGGSGGAPGSGGVTAAGGAGGAPANGGAPGSGGADATGGTLGTGGTTATGTGGVTANGGASGSGGDVGTGGVTASGGNTGTGGVVATGGANGTGGAGTGGATGSGGGGGAPCGPGNCTGCCGSDGQCVRNVTAQQCGTKGAACVACGPCQICGGGSSFGGGGGNAGTCTIDPASQWTIVADSAQLATSPSGGGTWDPKIGDEGGSAPDPFCEYENPANDVSSTTAGVTSTVTDSFSPTWDQTITPSGVTVSASALMASKPAWRIWVGDEDCASPKNCGTLGQIACSYQQPISAEALMSGGLTISNYQSCVSLTLSFVCQP